MADLNLQYRQLGGLILNTSYGVVITAFTFLKVLLNTVLFLLSGGLYIRWTSERKPKVHQVPFEKSSDSSLETTPRVYMIKAEPFSGHIPKTQSRLNLNRLLKSSHFAEKKSWWEHAREDIVFIPSQSLDSKELLKISAVHLYEERQLCMLFKLTEPNIRLVYVTSVPVDPAVVEYYLELIETNGTTTIESARSRLLLLSCNDPMLTPLSAKVLCRPQLLKKIKDFIDPACSYMIPFVSSNLERELALTLNIPLIGTDPSLNYWGTKAGSREAFSIAGVPIAPGTPLVFNLRDLAAEVLKLYLRCNKPKQIVVKLNVGFSGKGNAILSALKISPEETEQRVQELLETELEFCSHDENWEDFHSQIGHYGALAEVWLDNLVSSPSSQATILVSGRIEALSTHEQILDCGTYLGCIFPASEDYRSTLLEYTFKVGGVLAAKGCLERFAVDFVVTQTEGKLEVYCIEINIRWGGTSHPFISARHLTNSTIDQDGRMIGADGNEKFYVSSDNVQNDVFIGLNPDDFLELTRSDEKLQFNPKTATGVAFHLLSAIPMFGKFGMVAIGNSREEAQKLQAEALVDLERLASCICSDKIYKELDLKINSCDSSNTSFSTA